MAPNSDLGCSAFKRTANASPQACGRAACALQGYCTCLEGCERPLRLLAVAMRHVSMNRDVIPFGDAVSTAKDLLVRTGDLIESSLQTYFRDWDDLTGWAASHDVGSVPELTNDLVGRFLQARDAVGGLPAVGSQHRRRSSARKLFACLRALDVIRLEHDPTVHLPLPPRSTLEFRPLTTDEVEACRWASRYDWDGTRYPAIWALAEAGATTTELTAIRRDDVHPEDGLVIMPGGPRTKTRTVPLSPWGISRLSDHLARVDFAPEEHVVYGGKGLGGRRSTLSNAIGTIFTRAGLGDEPDIRPDSVRAWRGKTLLNEGASLRQVARRLGKTSLDATALLVGDDWEAVED